MAELPASVRTSLWVTAAWRGAAPDGSPRTLDWDRVLPDLDAVGGDLGMLEVWRSMGERALLVCLPGASHPRLLPRASAETTAAVLTAGECLIAPTLGGVLVPQISVFGAPGAAPADRGHRLDWRHHDSEGLGIHRVEALDPRQTRRHLQEAILEATTELASTGGVPFSDRPSPALGGRDHGLALPDGIPEVCRAGIATAALITEATHRALAAGSDALTVADAAHRESVLRRLAGTAEGALEEFTNAAVAVLAGWRPAP